MSFATLRSPGAFHAVLALLLAVGATVYAGAYFLQAADTGGAWNDDTIYRYGGKVLAIGRVSVPEPAEPTAFLVPGSTSYEGRRFGKYYPGFPAALAVGERLNSVWAVNPLLAGLLVFGTFLLGRTLASPGVGLAAAALLALSPLVRNMATVYLSHVLCAACLVYSWFLVVRARRSGSLGAGFAGGALWAGAFATRPLTALCLLLPLGIVAASDLLRRRAGTLRWNVGFAAAAALSFGGILAWNAALTGDPFLSAYEIAKPRDAFGFVDVHPNSPRGFGPYTPAGALVTLRAQLRSAADTLFSFPLRGAAAFALSLPFLAVVLRRRARSLAALLAISAMVLVAVHFFYPGTRGVSATGFGPRYYFEGVPGYFLLLALAYAPFAARHAAARWVAVGVFAALALGAAGSFCAHWSRGVEYHSNRLTSQNRRLEAFLETLPPGRRLVFVDISTYNEQSAMLANRPDLEEDNLVAIYRQPDQNRAVLDAYPGREAFLLRWVPAFDTPNLVPYAPDSDSHGPPRSFPYFLGKGMRFPPLAERARRAARGDSSASESEGSVDGDE